LSQLTLGAVLFGGSLLMVLRRLMVERIRLRREGETGCLRARERRRRGSRGLRPAGAPVVALTEPDKSESLVSKVSHERLLAA
jgi:hypothetical protein